jgi:hypothetical protein
MIRSSRHTEASHSRQFDRCAVIGHHGPRRRRSLAVGHLVERVEGRADAPDRRQVSRRRRAALEHAIDQLGPQLYQFFEEQWASGFQRSSLGPCRATSGWALVVAILRPSSFAPRPAAGLRVPTHLCGSQARVRGNCPKRGPLIRNQQPASRRYSPHE